jgi:hypothetical protein
MGIHDASLEEPIASRAHPWAKPVGVAEQSLDGCGLGDGTGGEADFSTALLTKCVSSFGRNDGAVDLEEKTDNGKSKCKDEMRGFFPIRRRSGSE